MASVPGLNGRQALPSYHRSPIDFLFIQTLFEPEIDPSQGAIVHQTDGPLQIAAGPLPLGEEELRNENAELRRKNLVLETKLDAIK